MKSIEPIRTNFSDEQIKELYIRTFEKIHMRKPNETENRLILDIFTKSYKSPRTTRN